MATKKSGNVKPGDLLRTLVDDHEGEEGYGYVYGDKTEDVFFAPDYFYSTGLTLVDTILGNGGFGSGRITEIFGPNRTGKSELTQKICAEFLRKYHDGLVLFWDQEQAIDKAKMDANPIFRCDRMAVLWNKYAEQVFTEMISMITKIHDSNPKVPVLIVLDSLAALDTKAELDVDLEDAVMMCIARVMSRALRRIRPVLQQTSTHLLITNQIRHKPNTQAFVEPESPGGEALKFWADYRIRTGNRGNFWLKGSAAKGEQKGPPDGIVCSFKTIKNKLAPPLREVDLPLLFKSVAGQPSGLSECWSLFAHMKKSKIINVSGGKYKMPGSDDGFGLDAWPLIWGSQNAEVMAALKPWQDAFMLVGEQDLSEVLDSD